MPSRSVHSWEAPKHDYGYQLTTCPHQAQQIAGLQGLGKAIAPRIGGAETEKVGKRDLAGFDRALTFAEAALTKGPKIQLGTGAEGSGVGIIVDNTPAGMSPDG